MTSPKRLARHLRLCFENGSTPNLAAADAKLWFLALNTLVTSGGLDAAAYAARQLTDAFPVVQAFKRTCGFLERLPAVIDDPGFTGFVDSPDTDVQLSRRRGATAVLFAFTGRFGSLGAPLPVTHRWFGPMGVHVVYLRDRLETGYCKGIPSIGRDRADTMRGLVGIADRLGADRRLCYGGPASASRRAVARVPQAREDRPNRGPFASLEPDAVRPHADVLFTCELEDIAADFFADLEAESWKSHYDGGRADIRRAPLPRWDLYPVHRAMVGALQTTRGCPFECEFCDVIQYQGRKQRHKDVSQVIAELDVLYGLGFRQTFLTDDNFTVHRQFARAMLDAIAKWNEAHAADPMRFVTQASLDIARDADLLEPIGNVSIMVMTRCSKASASNSLAVSTRVPSMRCSALMSLGTKLVVKQLVPPQRPPRSLPSLFMRA